MTAELVEAIGKLIEKFGLPMALVFVVGFAIWRFIVWLRPIGETLVKTHTEFVSAVKMNCDNNTNALQAIATGSALANEKLDHVCEKLDDLKDNIKRKP